MIIFDKMQGSGGVDLVALVTAEACWAPMTWFPVAVSSLPVWLESYKYVYNFRYTIYNTRTFTFWGNAFYH